MSASTTRGSIHRISTSLLLLIALSWASAAMAGGPMPTVFNVTNNGASSWVIDGVENPPLDLVRGRTYQLALQNVAASHPFYVNTSNTTGAANQYTTGVINNGGTGNTIIQFTVPLNAPDSLFYNCGNHGSMNGTISITSDTIFASGFDLTPR